MALDKTLLVKKLGIISLMFIVILTSLIEFIIPTQQVEAKDNIGVAGLRKSNFADASRSSYNPFTYEYLKPSYFVRGGGNKYIRNGSRSAWYTCWGYGSEDYDFYARYGQDTDKRMSSLCFDGGKNMKRLEYEVFAETRSAYNSRKPYITKYNDEAVLQLNGWATLGGYTNHTTNNQSSYIVAVKQVNGVDSTNPEDVIISKNRNLGNTVTDALDFGGLAKATSEEYNKVRGIAYNNGRYENGKNFEYAGVGFVSNIPLDRLFDNGEQEGEYRLYLVKRVEDMIVKSPISIPQADITTDYEQGELTLTGNTQTRTIRANGTAVFVDGVSDANGGKIPGMSSGNDYLGYLNNMVFDRMIMGYGTAVSFYVYHFNQGGRTRYGEHYSPYFVFGNDSSVLKYKITKKKLQIKVNHIDMDTGRAIYVKQSDGTLKLADKGSGEYVTGKKVKFTPYISEGDKGLLTNKTGEARYLAYSPMYISTTINNKMLTYTFKYKDYNKGDKVLIRYIDSATGELLKNPIEKDLTTLDPQPLAIDKSIITDENDREYKYSKTDPIIDETNFKPNKGLNIINVYYDKRPQLKVEYYEKNTGNKLFEDIITGDKGSSITINPPSTFEGKYVRLTDEDTSIIPLDSDTNIRIPYAPLHPDTSSTGIGIPFEELNKDEIPKVNLGEMSWRIFKASDKGLNIKLDLNVDKNDSVFKSNDVKINVSKGDSINTTNSSDSFYKTYKPTNGDSYQIKEDLSKDLVTTSKEFNNKNLTKYKVDVDMKYYNIKKYDSLICIDSASGKDNVSPDSKDCVKKGPDKFGDSHIYGTGNGENVGDNDTIKINGKDVPAVKSIKKTFILDIDTETGKVVDVNMANYDTEKNYDYKIGRSVSLTDLENSKDNNITTDSSEKVEHIYSDIPYFITALQTQQSSVPIDENIKYDNSFNESLPDPEKDSYYFIDELDKNLEKELNTGSGEDDKNKIKLNFITNNDTFKSSKLFDVSKKYGVQSMTDIDKTVEVKDVKESERNNKLEQTLINEGLSTDEIVPNKLAEKNTTSFYLPIDDEKYKPGTNNMFKDDVELNDLGLNDITFKYSKEYYFRQYLLGNVGDEPVYSQEKRNIKQVTYPNQLSLDKEVLKEIKDKTEQRQPFYNMFRITDDGDISGLITK